MLPLITNFQRRLSRLGDLPIATFLVGLTIVLLVTMANEDYSVGFVIKSHKLEGVGNTAAQVGRLGNTHELVVLPHALEEGRWFVARGEDAHRAGEWRVLSATASHVLPAPSVKTVARVGVGDFLSEHRDLALILGVTTVLAGLFLARVAGALLLGGFVAVLSWHALVLAALEGLVVLPPGSGPMILLLGFVVGTVLGFREHSVLSYLANRAAVAIVLLATAPGLANTFGVPTGVAELASIFATLLSPALGIVLLGSFFFSAGLTTAGGVSYVILGVIGVLVHIFSRGRMLASIPFSKRFGSRAPQAAGEVPLVDLVTG